MSALSDWFKERRDALKLTQVQIASRLGVNQATISQIEHGKPPDAEMMKKIDAVLGKFSGSYVPAQSAPGTKKIMSSKAKEGLKAYREAKENNFYLEIDNSIHITADRNQYILKQGANASYFIDLKALMKYLVVSQVRQSAVSSIQEIVDKIDETYELIEKKFDNYDPANIAANNVTEEDDE